MTTQKIHLQAYSWSRDPSCSTCLFYMVSQVCALKQGARQSLPLLSIAAEGVSIHIHYHNLTGFKF
jgi:hypothetical protein